MTEFNDNQHWAIKHSPVPVPPGRKAAIVTPVGDDGYYDAMELTHVGDSDEYNAAVFSYMGEGPKGAKGDPTYFDDLTPEQLQEIYQAASFVGNKSYDAIVTTSGSSTSAITLPFDFSEFDMLFVDVNGLDLAEGDDYTITGNLVTLSTPLPAGQDVHFRALKYDVIDGDKNIVNAMGRKDYNTVAEMQADTELEPGDICHTLGFHVAGDGGAAWYKIKSHGVANGIDILDLENDCVAFLQITGDYVTPEMFGAWGDGEHDDTEFLKAAFAYSNCDLVGNKTYIFSEQLEITNNVNGNMAVMQASDIRYISNMESLIYIHSANVVFSNVNLYGTITNDSDRYPNLTYSQRGIVIGENARQVKVSNCNIYNVACGAVVIWANNLENIDVSNLESFNTGIGLLTEKWSLNDESQPLNVHMKNCTFRENVGAVIHGVASFVAECCRFESKASGLPNEVRISDALGVTSAIFSNCSFIWSGSENSGGRALDCAGYRKTIPGQQPGTTDYATPGYNAKFINCKFTNVLNTTETVVTRSCDFVSFENCIFGGVVKLTKNNNATNKLNADFRNCVFHATAENGYGLNAVGVRTFVNSSVFTKINAISNFRGITFDDEYMTVVNSSFEGCYLAVANVSASALLSLINCNTNNVTVVTNASTTSASGMFQMLSTTTKNNMPRVVAVPAASLDACLGYLPAGSLVYDTTNNRIAVKNGNTVYTFSHD